MSNRGRLAQLQGNKSENVQLPNPQKDTDFTFPSGRSNNDAIA
jgi:hypothetical protein